MRINYPNNYLSKLEKENKKDNTKLSYINSNKGMMLEKEINLTNEYYRNNDIALIYKKPTPIQVVKMSKDNKHITKAYFLSKSTTDYNGIYKGKYIDFEAKECTSLTSFPLKNIKEYQLNHLKKVYLMGGIGFIIFYFKNLEKYYLLFIQDILNFISNFKRESIPIEYFINKGFLINRGLNPILDYLKIIEEIYLKQKNFDLIDAF